MRRTVLHAAALLLVLAGVAFAALHLDLPDGGGDFSNAERYLEGQRPYRDFELLTSLLPVYTNALLVAAFGPGMIPMAAWTVVAIASGLGVLASVVYRETDGDRELTLAFVCLAAYLGGYRWPRSNYTWNAVLLVAVGAALYARIRARGRPGGRVADWLGVGLVVGAAIGMKQNIGGVALLVAGVWLLRDARLAGARAVATRLAALALGALVVPGGLLLDLWGRGLLADMIRERERLGSYLGHTVSPFATLAVTPVSAADVMRWLVDAGGVALLAAAAAVCAAVLLTRRAAGASSTAGAWAILGLGMLACLYPRADSVHAGFVLPFVLAGAVIAGHALTRQPRHAKRRALLGRAASVAVLACGLLAALALARGAWDVANGRRVVLHAFPAAGMLTFRERLAFLERVRAAVDTHVSSVDTLLIVDSSGCFLNHFLGVRAARKPCFFAQGVVRPGEVAAAAAAIEDGRIQALLVPAAGPGSSEVADELRAVAERVMEPRAEVGGLRLFVARRTARA